MPTFFKKGSIVCDVCGVKEYITEKCEDVLGKNGVFYVGTHPMAGREFSGFDYSQAELFEDADFIITKTDNTDKKSVKKVAALAKEMGFGEIVYSTPEEHDKIIAYTSQLAHIVSSAYIKSPTFEKQPGFSAGSFLDMTRVAKLNEKMWTSLFLLNRKALKFELDMLIAHLKQFRSAIKYEDDEELAKLLADGRKRKEKNLKENGSGYEKPDVIFVDALTKIDTDSIPYKSIIHGDALSYSIAAASIIAKVTRDRIMRQWDEVYPQYGFAKHKGYGTASHIQAIKEYGICPLHRLSFVKNFIQK